MNELETRTWWWEKKGILLSKDDKKRILKQYRSKEHSFSPQYIAEVAKRLNMRIK